MTRDTIFALSSGRPPAAVAVVRISGPAAHRAGVTLAGRLPAARRAVLRKLKDADGAILDQALVLRFDGPASATGEDIVELHVHGGRAVADAVLGALGEIDGLRLAVAGEFTRRAFDNGRIDLTEAEGLADLLEAETEAQRQAALALAEGGLRRQIEGWQAMLLGLSARAEAAIDYAEEDDTGVDPSLSRDCGALAKDLGEWLERPRVEPLKDGVRVVVAGPPNAGKSSLINAIAGSDKAIVADLPGTTRDSIEVPLAVDGLAMVWTDTAGIRDTDDRIERIGVDRARTALDSADVIVWLGEGGDAPHHQRLVRVHSRCDLQGRETAPEGSLAVSAVTGQGIASLLREVARLASVILPGEDALSLNRRQAQALTDACGELGGAATARDDVIAAEHLRAARAAFDRLTGRAGVEDVLDALFGRFCLGK